MFQESGEGCIGDGGRERGERKTKKDLLFKI